VHLVMPNPFRSNFLIASKASTNLEKRMDYTKLQSLIMRADCSPFLILEPGISGENLCLD
jgi:hypothetical protein